MRRAAGSPRGGPGHFICAPAWSFGDGLVLIVLKSHRQRSQNLQNGSLWDPLLQGPRRLGYRRRIAGLLRGIALTPSFGSSARRVGVFTPRLGVALEVSLICWCLRESTPSRAARLPLATQGPQRQAPPTPPGDPAGAHGAARHVATLPAAAGRPKRQLRPIPQGRRHPLRRRERNALLRLHRQRAPVPPTKGPMPKTKSPCPPRPQGRPPWPSGLPPEDDHPPALKQIPAVPKQVVAPRAQRRNAVNHARAIRVHDLRRHGGALHQQYRRRSRGT